MLKTKSGKISWRHFSKID